MPKGRGGAGVGEGTNRLRHFIGEDMGSFCEGEAEEGGVGVCGVYAREVFLGVVGRSPAWSVCLTPTPNRAKI